VLDRDEYESVIQMFLVELNELCADASEPKLREMPRFEQVLGEYLLELRDPANDPAQVLWLAFGYLDEYVHADWQKVISAAYEAYIHSKKTGTVIDDAK